MHENRIKIRVFEYSSLPGNNLEKAQKVWCAGVMTPAYAFSLANNNQDRDQPGSAQHHIKAISEEKLYHLALH
jgi:hypothetical protein